MDGKLSFLKRPAMKITTILFIIFTIISCSTVAYSQAGGFGDPSNMVGIWKMILQPGTHLISFPILPDEATVESIIGNQLPGGEEWESSTRILTTGTNALRGSFFSSANDEWIGTLHDLDLRIGYWLIIPEDSDPVTITLLGAALEDEEVAMGEMQSGVNLVSTGFPYPTTLASSGLVQSGVSGATYISTSDRIYTWQTGSLHPVWYDPQQGWRGTSFSFEPMKGYIIVVAEGHNGFDWTQTRPQFYNQGAGGLGGQGVQVSHDLDQFILSSPVFEKPPWDKDTPPQKYPVNRRKIRKIPDPSSQPVKGGREER